MLGELTYALFKFTHTLLKLNDAKCLRDNKHVTGIAGIGIGDCLRLVVMRNIEYRPPNLFAPTIKFSSPRKGTWGECFAIVSKYCNHLEFPMHYIQIRPLAVQEAFIHNLWS